MKGKELIKKILQHGKDQGVNVKFNQRRGKGSHGTIFYGNKFQIISNTSKELKTGTYKAILKKLGIKEEDLR